MTHTCTQHQPGAYTCYSRCRCRCDDCRAEGNRVAKRYRYARETGAPLTVDASDVRDHLMMLEQSGMGRAEIARRSSTAPVQLLRIIRGDVRSVRRPTARRILAVQPTPIEEQETGRVSAVGTHRRIQALQAVGWSLNSISRELGTTPSTLRYLLGHPTCFAETRRRIAALYDRLWDQPPPTDRGHAAGRSINTARRNGWPPPLAWDDGHGPHGIDNPAAKPATAPDPTGRGHRAAELAMLLDAGESPEHAAQQCGWQSRESALKWLNRNGHADLAQRIRTDPETLRRCA